MRSLSAAALAKIAERFGNEPINIIEVAWSIGGSAQPYADRAIGTIPGKILELDALDSIVNVAGNGSSQQIRVTLDDAEGNLKAILDSNDIHQRSVWVYQYFDGMDVADKFLLFKGQISSPINYSEGERKLTFTVVSQIEDTDIGFTADQGEFDFVSDDLIGQAWPMCFGTVIQGKTLKLTSVYKGIVAKSLGVADFCLPYRRDALQLIANFWSNQATNYALASEKHRAFSIFYSDKAAALNPLTEATRVAKLTRLAEGEMQIYDTYRQNADQFQQQAVDFATGAANVQTAYTEQVATQPTTFDVIGGEKFPRGPISLKVGEVVFNGSFTDDTDTFVVNQIIHPKEGTFAIANEPLEVPQLPGVRIYSVAIPDTRLDADGEDDGFGDIIFFLFDAFPPDILSQYSIQMFGEHAGYIFEEAGSVVEIATDEGQEYIVSIVPGTVLNVSAYLNNNGVRKLATVPEEYYTVENRNYGGTPNLTAVILTLEDALSKQEDAEWGDELFVTFESDVGPNTVDVLEYLIETFTEFTTDSTSFDAARLALENYPSHFQITDRKQVLQALREISWQARCAIWLSNDVFYLRYLPAVPTSISTFTDIDVDFQTMELGFTPTESLVTKMVCKWRPNGAQEKDNIVILQHNVKKYGTKSQDFDFYIYNAADFVIKSATFWLIRYSNTWKKLKFQTPLHKLNVESLDGITLNFNNPWVASSAVVGVVEQAQYESDSQQLSFEVWTPVRAGEMTAYDFAHPAAIDSTLKFPTTAEENAELDGGVSPWKESGAGFSLGPGNFSNEYTNPDYYKFLKRRYNDRGQPRPSDQNDGSPGAPVVKTTPALTFVGAGSSSPVANNVTPTPQIVTPPVTSGSGLAEITFDTPIIDNVTDPENPITTTLADILLYDEDLEVHGARLAYFWEGD